VVREFRNGVPSTGQRGASIDRRLIKPHRFPIPEDSSTEAEELETVITDEYFVVWLWSGCRAAVSLDGQDQPRPGLSIPVP